MTAFILAVIFCVWFAFKIYFFFQRRKQKRLTKLGLKGEKKAKRFLKRNGYKVVEEQHEIEHAFYVNGKELVITLKPDFLVEKNGVIYVAEVKSGQVNSSINHAATRRQLLEYAKVDHFNMVLLVDMNKKQIFEIEF